MGEGKYIAWTVDDGASPEAIRGYAEFSKRTNTRLTFFINASYVGFKDNVDALRPLVQSGQIQIANHTYNHADLTTLDADGVKAELQRNEDEIMSARVIYMRSLRYMLPQQIILGHLNYETIVPILDKLKGLLDERGLTPVTIHDYYGDASEEEIKAAAPSPTATTEPSETPSADATSAAPTPTPTPTPTPRYEDEVAATKAPSQPAATTRASQPAQPQPAATRPAATSAPAAANR